jgi:streptomycin 6-kinase
VQVPPVLARNVVSVWGEEGRAWLAGLPGLLDGVLGSWHLRPDGGPFPLSYHWVMPVTRPDGSAAVLKVGLPDDGHLAAEAAALRAYGGHGAVRLLADDPARGALLLERADPGTPARALVPHEDGAALAALLSVRRALHAAPPPADGVLPDLARLGGSFDRYLRAFPGGGPLPRRLVVTATRLFDELCSSAPAPVVLHGDLHHDNVLRSARSARGPWLAIDPHGWVGDPGYDLGAILYNPDPDVRDPALLALVPDRLERIVETATDVPRERVVAWCFVMAVLSDVWNTEGSEPVSRPATRAIQVAGLLEPFL